jgi:O-antigen ligase
MKKILTPDNAFLLIIFCIPAYLIKVLIFGIPTNILELLALFAIALNIIRFKKILLNKLPTLPKSLLLGYFLIVSGLFISTYYNNSRYLASLSIIKSWFLIPMFFAFTMHASLSTSMQVERIFKRIYYSTATVGTISIFYKLFSITTYDNRLSSIFLSPNYLSMFLSSGIFFCLYFVLKEFSIRKYSLNFFINLFLLSIIIAPLYYTYSYGAWIAVMTSLFLTIFLFAKNKKLLFIGAFALFAIISLLFFSQVKTDKFKDMMQQSSRSSFTSRQTIWHVAESLILKNPIDGIGPGNFQESYLAMQKNYPPYLEWAVPQPHNIFLAFWLQSGIFGFIGFLLLLFSIFNSLIKIIADKKNAALAAPLFGFFTYTILHGLIDTTYWKNDLAFLFWICIFLTLSLSEISELSD